MSSVGRYTKAIAKPGQGEALARKLLEVAVSVTETPGCQLYLINRSPGEPDVVWVTELWRSQEELDAALNSDEARAATVGLSLQQLRPGARQTFGHRHALDEEVYVILAGSGRVAIDDEIQPLRRLDAVRVAPGSTRAFEAGPDGLQILATAAHRPGDAEILPGFWPEE